MPTRKQPAKKTPAAIPAWRWAIREEIQAVLGPQQVILEQMRSANRATIETVEASRAALEQRIDRLEQETPQKIPSFTASSRAASRASTSGKA